jgi:hypothetical protein
VTINDPGYEVPATQSHDPRGAADLRHIADHLVAPSCRPAEHGDRSSSAPPGAAYESPQCDYLSKGDYYITFIVR